MVKKENLSVLLILMLISFLSCQKDDVSDRIESIYHVKRIVDSSSQSNFQRFEYNSNNKTIKYVTNYYNGSSQFNGYTDTFIYSNDILIKSHYNLGQIIQLNPYGKSEYTYLNSRLATSSYYFGSTSWTNAEYGFDNLGRLNRVKQIAVVTGERSYETRFEYDVNSNLIKIFIKEGIYPEYLCKEFLNYDNKANPFYNMPWDWNLNVYIWNDHKMSKNNYGRVKRYDSNNGSLPSLISDITINYSYDSDGKVIKRSFYNNMTSSYQGAELLFY